MKAFPVLDYQSGTNEFKYSDKGMDLRDYFAAKAMEQTKFQYMPDGNSVHMVDARFCYLIADAMMKAREQ